MSSFPEHPGYTERREVAKKSLCRCCLMPSRRLCVCVEPPLWLLRLPNPFYRAATDWRVVLIRGDGLGGMRRSDREEKREREREKERDSLIQTHSNS